MSFSRTTPHDALPLLPPATDVQTAEVMRACIAASRRLGELKGSVIRLPDPTLLINSIPLQEAKSSSEVENIVTTQDALYLADSSPGGDADPHTKEVLRYRSALRLASNHVAERGLTLPLLREVCSLLMSRSMSFRAPDERVQLGNPDTSEVAYTPPTGGPIVVEKLENLMGFLGGKGHAADYDPLVRMAIGHYQFEAIHPFLDGNGRTGRILNLVTLLHDELLPLPVLYLSRYILAHKTRYYRLLRDVTEAGAWSPWIVFMLQSVEETAAWTLSLLARIEALFVETLDNARTTLPARVYSKELIETVFRQPYCKTAFLVEAGIAKRQTAADYLKHLEAAGILTSERHGREVIYKNLPLLDLFIT